MDARVRLIGPEATSQLSALESWLIDHPELRRAGVQRPPVLPRPGEMGAVNDVLVVALGTGGVGATLAGALVTWLRTRVDEVTVHVRTARGEVTVTARSTDPDDLFESLRPVLAPVTEHDS
jgi:hypothetical protein